MTENPNTLTAKEQLILSAVPYPAWAMIKFIGLTQRLKVVNLNVVKKIFNEMNLVLQTCIVNKYLY